MLYTGLLHNRQTIGIGITWQYKSAQAKIDLKADFYFHVILIIWQFIK